MRSWILFLKKKFFSGFCGSINLNLNCSTKFLLTIILFFAFAPYLSAQWVNNPASNTKLVINTSDPINISSTGDFKGGAFIFWQDNKDSQKEVYFIHVDEDGKISFRADGKKVSTLSGAKYDPVSTSSLPNSAVVVWKGISKNSNGELFAQRVIGNGNLAWTASGKQITSTNDDVKEYAVVSDVKGNTFISYLAKDPELMGEYKICLKRITPNGKISTDSASSIIAKSTVRKGMTNIAPDDSGGAYIFWLEIKNNKSIIFAQHVDSTGKSLWNKNPMMISSPNQNVINYTVTKTGFRSVYAVWQIQKPERDIYHQIISEKGKSLWNAGGKICVNRKGSQIFPQVAAVDSSIYLSWTDELDNDRNIFIQKYNTNGKPLWNEKGIPVVDINGDQFGQKIITDNSKGVILAWIDRRADSVAANIYAQKLNFQGKRMWDSTGNAIASGFNTPKSYLSLISDLKGGALAIFKEKKNGKNTILGQKIFNSGTYVSQLIGFNTELKGDSVSISWYSANETSPSTYYIEKTVQSDTGNIKWQIIRTLKSGKNSEANYYNYVDYPKEHGTLYYRVKMNEHSGKIQTSEISRVIYLESANRTMVTQNNPNPFTDSTIINFYLPSAAKVTFEFFDSHVEKISEIVNKNFPAGENAITFSGQGLNPGIYFYRFQSGDYIEVKKMVIIN